MPGLMVYGKSPVRIVKNRFPEEIDIPTSIWLTTISPRIYGPYRHEYMYMSAIAKNFIIEKGAQIPCKWIQKGRK